MRAGSVLKLAANSGSFWLCSSTQPPHCDSVIAFWGGHFLLICTCSSCLLLSFLSLQFSLEPFVSISLQIEKANKLQINIFLIFGYFSLFQYHLVTKWQTTFYLLHLVGLDFSAQSSWPKENQDVCAGWSGSDDSDTGTPRSVHENAQVSLCTFRGLLLPQKYSPEGVVQGWVQSRPSPYYWTALHWVLISSAVLFPASGNKSLWFSF